MLNGLHHVYFESGRVMVEGMILTTQKDTGSYAATLEAAY